MNRLFAAAADNLAAFGWKPPRYAPQSSGMYLHVAVYSAAQKLQPIEAHQDVIDLLYQEAIGMLHAVTASLSLMSWADEEGRTQDEVIALLRVAEDKYG
ncbi:hypothetical protein BAMBUS_02230 [Brevundimonas phage vB_BpoS-Bambus]|nr:hypothetical protein BAMBUS_02230 [Brevundimonas phage vB_BpoS-Bambus]